MEENLFKNMNIFIAGGSVRKAFHDEIIGTSDIDVFFRSKEDCDAACVTIRKMFPGGGRIYGNCESFTVHIYDDILLSTGGICIQLITMNTWPTMEELLQSVDFTVCQFGYYSGSFYYTEQAVIDSFTKTLSYSKHNNQPASLGRYVKYLNLGYTPSLQSFSDLFVTNSPSNNSWALETRYNF
jgi:hypothetical protein